MAVPISEVGRRGALELVFTSRECRTVLLNLCCEVPFKITRLHRPRAGGIAHLVIMHCTAGLFGGDTVECSIHVEAGARVLVTQQSATKVHPSQARLAVLRHRIRVDAGGELHMHCEPLIPFAQSRLSLTTIVDLERGARFSLWEGLMAGRVGRGEVWQFDELSSEVAVNLDAAPVYLDRFRLSRRGARPVENWAMGSARYLGTGLHYHEGLAGWTEDLHDRVPAAGVDSPFPNLTVMRSVVQEGPEFRLHRTAFVELALGTRGALPPFDHH